MKRIYKPLSLMYLLVTGAVLFQGQVNASEGVIVEGGRPAEGISVETEIQRQEKEQEEIEEARKASPVGGAQIGSEAQEQEGETPSLTTGEEEKVSVSLSDIAKRYVQQAQEKGISVARTAQAKVIDLLQNFKERITQIYNILRNLRETIANLPAEKRQNLENRLLDAEKAIQELEEISNKALNAGLSDTIAKLNEGFSLAREEFGSDAVKKLLTYVLDAASTVTEGEQGEYFNQLKNLAQGLPDDLTALQQSLDEYK